MNDIEKLASIRCDRTKSNMETRVIDLLRAAAHDIETGKVKADSLLILFGDCPTSINEPWAFETYRAGCTRDREIVMLTMGLDKAIRNWRGD